MQILELKKQTTIDIAEIKPENIDTMRPALEKLYPKGRASQAQLLFIAFATQVR